MTCLWVRSLSWHSLALIISIIPVERNSCSIDANAIIIIRVELLLLHLLDTGTHLAGNHLPWYLFAYNGWLLSTVNNCSSVWATPESMETTFVHTTTFDLFKCSISYWLFIILVWSKVFLNWSEPWEIEVDRVTVDWYACIRSDVYVLVSLINTIGNLMLRIVDWNLSIRRHLTRHYKFLLAIIVRYHVFKLNNEVWCDIIINALEGVLACSFVCKSVGYRLVCWI